MSLTELGNVTHVDFPSVMLIRKVLVIIGDLENLTVFMFYAKDKHSDSLCMPLLFSLHSIIRDSRWYSNSPEGSMEMYGGCYWAILYLSQPASNLSASFAIPETACIR